MGTGDANYYAFFDKPIPENLAANRSGVLTEGQQVALQRHIENAKTTITILGIMLVCAALVLCFLFWKIDASDGVVSLKFQFLNAGVIIVVLGVFMAWFAGDWFVFFAGDDLENRAVKTDIGRIEWDGRRYQMRTDTRLLRSLRSGVSSPPPGHYSFYYLPRTGLVVLAEEMFTAETAEPRSALLQALANSNNFTDEDLAHNRNEMLSKRQENQLIQVVAWYLLILLVAAVLFGIMTPQIMRVVSSTGYLLLVIVPTVLALRFGWSALQIIVDLWNGRVKSVDGQIAREIRRSRYSNSYYYVMDGFRFQVSQAAHNALIEGRPYRVYYVPHSKRLISLELL
jgi:hypothetical protein